MDNTTKIFIMVSIAWIFSEVLKIIIDSIRNKNFNIKKCFRYGGMPSSHSAFVTSLAFSIFLIEGFTTAFLLSLAIWILILRDLMVIRGAIRSNSDSIRKISKGKYNTRSLTHTLLQISVGIFLGLIIPLVVLFFL